MSTHTDAGSAPARERRGGGPVLGRRDLLKLGLLAGGAGLLGACSGGSDGSVVRWQAIPSYSLQTTDPNRERYLEDARAAWERGSGVRLDPEVTTASTATAMAKLVLQTSQGRAPDVSQVDGYVFGRTAKHAVDLDARMAAAGLALDDWFPSLQAVMTAGGDTVRALQFTTDVRVLYYRKDLVDEPPTTWDDVLSLAGTLGDGRATVLLPAGRGEGAVFSTLWPLYWGQGHDLFDADGAVAFQTGPAYDAMQAALQVVADAVDRDAAPRRVSSFSDENAANSDVVAGRAAMFVGGNWQAPVLDAAIEGESFYDRWGVAPLPTLDGGAPVAGAGGWVWAAFTDDPDLADAGIDWVIDAYVADEGMAQWCSIGGYLPPRRSVYDLPAFAQNPFTPVFRDHLEQYSRPRPGVADYLQVSDSLQIALSSVAAGTTAPEPALDQALTRVV